MALFKCKMCGGDIELAADKTFGTCEYCGSSMTFPKVDDDQRAAAFNRGNHFRRIGEFDKALSVYERIVREDDTDAEAHWCCALCRFGIEYVEDPDTFEYIPTCHRASFDSFLEDVDYRAALKYSDGVTRRQYQKDGAKIAEVQRGILATSQSAQSYDVFICYKESDENGNRTRDSLMAQEIYYQLTEQGRKVFFSRITLEDVAGTQYEPYIFAALNSAKVMIVVGTKPEYLNAVWVRNEWSRFLAMMKKDRHKLLLPCYRDMDPYDMPEQLSVLQSYDMGKIGFIQDLSRGIAKVLDAEKNPVPVKETVIMQAAANTNTAPLLKRAFMFLEDGEWERADEFCEQVLNLDPECAQAYLGKLMAELRVRTQEELKNCEKPFDHNNHYRKVIRFADDALRGTMAGYIHHINERNEIARLEALYQEARRELERANSEAQYKAAAKRFAAINGYKDSAAFEKRCLEKAEVARLDVLYAAAKALMTGSKISNYQEAIQRFEVLADWRDSSEQIEICQHKIAEIEEQKARKAQKAQKPPKTPKPVKEQPVYYNRKKSKLPLIVAAIVCVAIAVTVIVSTARPKDGISEPADRIDAAQPTETTAAIEATEDSQTALLEAKYRDAVAQKDAGNLLAAIRSFTELGDYSDAPAQADNLRKLYHKPLRTNSIGTSGGGAPFYYGRKKDGTLCFATAHQFGQSVYDWENIIDVSVSGHIVGLKQDGTVVAAGSNESGECNVFDWTDIVAIAAGGYSSTGVNKLYTVGLKVDGTVVAVGNNEYGQCDVSDWTDIIAIWAGTYATSTYGLKSDGTVVAVGNNEYGQCDVSDWTDIVDLYPYNAAIIGVKADRTVVTAGKKDWNSVVSDWTDISAIRIGNRHIVALKSDGTVVATGNNEYGQCEVSGWTDIVAIYITGTNTVGLKADGTVAVAGDNSRGQHSASTWTDVVAVKCGMDLYGLKSDGTVVATISGPDFSGLTDIVDFYPYGTAIIGLKADGSTIIGGDIPRHNGIVISVISGWTDIKVPDRAKLASDDQNSKTVPLEAAKVGNYVAFGAYEQDNNLTNGKEPIEWQVLDVKDGKLFVISKYALDNKPYNNKSRDGTWEDCDLRTWLNNTFITTAFNAEEKAMIPTATVSADKNPDYYTDPGNTTQDQVFLLSIAEVNKYFGSDSARQCKATDYLIANRAYVDEDSGNCWWWLRTPGDAQYKVACIFHNGEVSIRGDRTYYTDCAVRPALWIDLNA